MTSKIVSNSRHSAALLLAGTLAWCGMPASALAQAQDASGEPLRLIIPYEPGGSVDLVGRGIAQRYTKQTGVTVIVENRAGAGGAIAAAAVARSPKDGKTLLLHTGTLTVESAAGKKVPYVLMKDLVPITKVADGPFALVVNTAFPANDLTELVKQAKANPGKFNYSSAGLGSSTNLAMEIFKERTGIDVIHVPYKGGSPSLNAVMAGEVQMAFSPLINAKPYSESGRLRALSTSTPKRATLWPDLPSSAESGVPNFNTNVWFGLFAPSGVPDATMAKLASDFRAVINAEETQQWLHEQGLEAVGDSPADFRKSLQAEIETLTATITKAGIKLN
ncbi:tripartite tricarboxylate transporter substrate binding protein [Bordetella petrii]|nr:tripartite tricarboxylate transporter substrate binding protein [Bordetella petrii]